MRYEFRLSEYWDVMDTIHEREDVETYGFRQIKIAEKEGSELYVFGYRVWIPELDMTVREGTESRSTGEDDEEDYVDSVVLYDGDEKDPAAFTGSYCNTYLDSLVEMTAAGRGRNTDPLCIIDDSEFDLWTDD